MEGDYEAVDYDKPPPLPQPLNSEDILEGKRNSSWPKGGGPLILPPPIHTRYSNGPKKSEKPSSSSSSSSSSPIPPPKPTANKKTNPLPLPGKKPQQMSRDSVSQDDYFPLINPKISSSSIYRSTNTSPTHTPSVHAPSGNAPSGHASSSVGDVDGETLMLSELVRKYSKTLPLRIRVDEGYCGSEEKYVISSGDIYHFHFVKNEKVVSVRDCGGNHFSIPLNSDIKFGLMYNPSANFQEAVNGYVFKSVADVAAAKVAPRLLRVLEVGDAKGSVTKKELLVVKKVGKPMLRKAFMKVYSITYKEEKTIQDDIDVSFTTDPQWIQLYIPEILECFPDSFPLECMMYNSEGGNEEFPSHLTTDTVSLTHLSIQSAILATTHWDDGNDEDIDDEDHVPISIPIEMEIEVTILEDADEDDLYTCTKNFIKTFDMSKINNLNDDSQRAGADGGDGQRLGCQRSINKRVRQGYEFRGVDITMSDKVYDNPDEAMSTFFRSVLNQPLPPTPFGGSPLPHGPSPPPVLPGLLRSHSTSRAQRNTIQLTNNAINSNRPVPPNRGQSLDSERGLDSRRSLDIGGRVADMDDNDAMYVNRATLPISFKNAPRPALVPTKPSSKATTKDVTKDTSPDSTHNPDYQEAIAELKSTSTFLRNLIDVTQGNLQKQVKVLEEREEHMQEDIRKLTMAVERLAEKCESLEDTKLVKKKLGSIEASSSSQEDMKQLKKKKNGSKEHYPSPRPSPSPSPCPSPPPPTLARDNLSPPPLQQKPHPPPPLQQKPHPPPPPQKPLLLSQKPLLPPPKPNPPPPLSFPQKSPKPSRGRSHTTTDDQNLPITVPLSALSAPAVPTVPHVPFVLPPAEVATPPTEVATAPTLEKLTKTVDPQQQKENMEDLRSMGVQEILHLLDIMKLAQYKEGFAEESIDGEILAECDEHILEEELQILNRLHRSRLMKVITGRHSATSLKHGLDPYGGEISRC